MSAADPGPDGAQHLDGAEYFEVLRRVMAAYSEQVGEWQGLPVPLEGFSLRLCRDHPWAERYRAIEADDTEADDHDADTIVNHWYSRKLGCDIYVLRLSSAPERAIALKIPASPDLSMDRLTLWLRTLGVSDAWTPEAEMAALDKLKSHLNARQWRHYVLTGTFLETSARSGVTYVFRRGRPTVALSARWPVAHQMREMRFLAALCLHPVGYYQSTWGGAMVPTDEVIAHLIMMRGDEAHFWGKAHHHQAWEAEAGI